MATNSFLKTVIINSRNKAKRFIIALEKAKNKSSKNIPSFETEDIKDGEKIQNIFKNT